MRCQVAAGGPASRRAAAGLRPASAVQRLLAVREERRLAWLATALAQEEHDATTAGGVTESQEEHRAEPRRAEPGAGAGDAAAARQLLLRELEQEEARAAAMR